MKISIIWRLIVSFSILIALTSFLGWKNLKVMNDLSFQTKQMYEHPFVVSNQSRNIAINILKVSNLFEKALRSKKQSEIFIIDAELNMALKNLQSHTKTIDNELLGDRTVLNSYLDGYENWIVSEQKLLSLLKSGEFDKALYTFNNEYSQNEKAILKNITALGRHADGFARKFFDASQLNVKDAIWSSIFILGIISVSAIIFVWLMIIWLIRPIKDLKFIIENIAIGDTSHQVSGIYRSDELGDISRSIANLSKNIESITTHAQHIADGDYTIKLTPKSDRDQLALAMQTMTKNLREISEHNNKVEWLQHGAVDIANVLRDDKSLDEFSENLLKVIVEYTSAQMGTLYTYIENSSENCLQLNATYACLRQNNLDTNIKIGDGIVGQAAKEGKIIVLESLPEDYMQIKSSIGQRTPDNLIVIPFLFQEQLRGVIELGYFGKINVQSIELLENIRKSIGIAYENIFSKVKLNNALNESQSIYKTLQAQEEELKVTNVQLVKQSSELKKRAREIEDSSKYKSEFLANMSHELRTPLNSLLLLSQSLVNNDESNLSEDEVDSVQVIHDSGQHLLSLINDILDISKVEAGQMVLHSESIEVSDLINSLNQRFVHMAQDKNITFDFTIEENTPAYFSSDRTKVEQILTNLIGNAIKFTSDGRVCLSIAKDNHNLVFKVTDTGIGIIKDKQTTIFEAFKQIDGSTTRNYGGTGLGLSIVTKFTHLLKGDISIDSDLGRGSTFTLTIPYLTAADMKFDIKKTERKRDNYLTGNKAGLITRKQEIPSINSSDLNNKTVLIVDDDIRNVFSLATILRKNKLNVQLASTGEKALNILTKKADIDIILMDIMMPEMDGYETTQKIRRQEAYQEIPILALTANAMKGDKEKCLASGANDYLSKPVDIKQLLVMMQKWLLEPGDIN
ncbi:MAG: response regulator [gamma proteobacterium symbiont of Taylorina sp.]|nr:response regulator [gamma proteobacterium symbiont of Taylorina sp.]